MVMSAKQRHVVGLGLTAIDPMLQVMAIEVTLAMTAGERAAAIARIQRAAQRRRHCALLAADVERVAVGVLRHRDEATVAKQALYRIDG